MHGIIFELDGKLTDLTGVWVHLQSPAGKDWRDFKVMVQAGRAPEVFDPSGMRDWGVPWPDFIWSQIHELGTFIVEAYFDAMQECMGQCRSPFRWVIATIDTVVENDGIELRGKALPFSPRQY